MHYHRYALDFYLLALSVARLTGDAELAVGVENTARGLARFARAMSDDRGHLPLFGDDDGGQLFPMSGRAPADVTPTLAWAAALLEEPSLAIEPANPPEEAFWLCACDPSPVACSPNRPAEAAQVSLFRDSGYATARTRRGDHIVLDTGHHGFLNGGHAHDDALSVVVALARRPFLIDPGTSTYTMNAALRDTLRASTSHNTGTVDGRTHSEPDGPFHWRTRTDAKSVGVGPLVHGAWMAGEHHAYAPLVHRRDVFVAEDGLVVLVDRLAGDDSVHQFELRWTLDRAWEYFPARLGARLIHSSGAEARMLSTIEIGAVRGGADAGWCAPVYGQLLPTWTLVAQLRGKPPIEVVTAFSDGSVPPALRIERDGGALTVIVERAGVEDEFRLDCTGVSQSRRTASSAGRN
jgi:hypothetical protein